MEAWWKPQLAPGRPQTTGSLVSTPTMTAITRIRPASDLQRTLFASRRSPVRSRLAPSLLFAAYGASRVPGSECKSRGRSAPPLSPTPRRLSHQNQHNGRRMSDFLSWAVRLLGVRSRCRLRSPAGCRPTLLPADLSDTARGPTSPLSRPFSLGRWRRFRSPRTLPNEHAADLRARKA